MPKISIVIPTYNRAHKIMRPINAIINQSFTDWELIIVDDCSTDKTSALIANVIDKTKANIKYFSLGKNSGPSRARNMGMARATGEYSAFLDSDDIWNKGFLESLARILDRNKDCGLAYCDSQIYDLRQKPYYTFVFEPYSYSELLASQGKIPTGSFMFRTNCWHQIDGFREDMIRGEDLEWQLRFGEIFSFIRFPEILHHYFRDKDGLIHTTNGEREKLRFSASVLNQTKREIKKRKYG